MATCLIALGSNLGDREATLADALRELSQLPKTNAVRSSRSYSSAPIGGPTGQNDFLNATTLLETTLEPQPLFNHLIEIEKRFGRKRTERWGARTLDLDLLLYEDRVIETAPLIVPHPRMSFRRFVLAPAAEIAPAMVVPTIGWPIQQLLTHLNMANSQLAIVSHSHDARLSLSRKLVDRFGARIEWTAGDLLFASQAELWPNESTTWLAFPRSLTPADQQTEINREPKLTIILDTTAVNDRPAPQPLGRGPTLLLNAADANESMREASAAVESSGLI
jgi:2-amino-4-hydroxy-6-hydroxymethyldihydropteridine diphosphokinase